ncbi:hypothetical protein SEA_BAXTERFOX_7 [Gordonia phage BaxterFox]|uniref:Uncharacterized protein n=1 Tax=Gordonia phage BaxterFox TaxID=1821549 RepID=A0A142KCI4_9CAUD|nr:head-tail connector protein [Gordonia phage BaxterFox]AMS03817.1 hypothetical protein SEA_BAXTERFOX_7 [Gordonia phage BaxterFox]
MMAAEYILTANSWRDAQGVRHHKGDVVTPPEAEVDRLRRAKAIATPEEIAEAEALAEAALLAQQEAAAARAEGRGDATAVKPDDDGDLESAVPPAIGTPAAGGKPRKVAPVKEWEDYAAALHEASGGKEGFPRADAEAMSKAELIEALQ